MCDICYCKAAYEGKKIEEIPDDCSTATEEENDLQPLQASFGGPRIGLSALVAALA